jgi:hypothetical protein
MLSACSFKKSQLENQTLKGHEELYSEPEKIKLLDLDADEKRIVIASTNDRHGNNQPLIEKFEDDFNKGNQTIGIGGTATMKNYLKILRDTYKNVVLVDSGDILSSSERPDQDKNFYKDLKYDAVTVGLRDFNLKMPATVENNTKYFELFAQGSSVPLLFSNLYELKTARVIEWAGTKPYVMKEINGVKVGIIGVVPDDIVSLTPVNNRVGLFVESMLQSTLKHARLLRSLGAEVVVVLTHQGIDCNTELSEETKLPLMKVNFEPQRENVCDLKSPLGEFLQKLPPHLVNVVVGGRNHQKMANFVNGTLVMAGLPDGKSFNYVEFVVNTKTKKVVVEKTVVHQPVLLCQEFFKETSDCFTEDETVDHKKRIPATFLGKPIEPNLDAHVIQERMELRVQDISKSLVTFNADLSYLPNTSGETQLLIMKMNGRELLTVLEQDYNHKRKNHWQPSPFLLKGEELSVSISGMDLDLNKEYRILTDLESVQAHKMLVKNVSRSSSEAIMKQSWTSIEEDSISSHTAAPIR